jgi:hypothetical protein
LGGGTGVTTGVEDLGVTVSAQDRFRMAIVIGLVIATARGSRPLTGDVHHQRRDGLPHGRRVLTVGGTTARRRRGTQQAEWHWGPDCEAVTQCVLRTRMSDD